MQSPAPAGGSSPASAIALSSVERPAFAHLFNLADPDRTGIVTGDAAVSFFAKSKLPPPVLGQIWAIADSANNGFLTPPSFSIALRLIAHAQRGEAVTEALAKRPGPPPTLQGITLPLSAQLTGSSQQPLQAVPPSAMPGVIEIKPEDRARYTRIFASSGPQGGLIDSDKAKDIFVKSKLPFDKLGAIWNLADTQTRGTLDLTDFIIGMHFIQNTMNGSLNSIPAALPPGLYEQAKGTAAASRLSGGGGGGLGAASFSGGPLAAQATGGSASAGAAPRQFTGQPLSASASHTFSPAPTGMSAFQSPQATGAGVGATSAPSASWDVTPEEKLRSDRFFDGLDVEKKGELEGGAVVPFFVQSKLNEAALAHIWDLSDITQTGTLTRDEFAVAMHLINQQLAGKELPQELQQSLIPPSMRSMSLPQAVDPQQSDTQKDLFSLMDDDPPPPTVSATSAFIAPSANAPVASNVGTAAGARSAASGPFDDDFFGGASQQQQQQPAAMAALSPTATGGSFGGGAAAAGLRSPPMGQQQQQAPGTPNRSGSMAAAPGFGAGAGAGIDQSAEYGNMSIQLQSTQKAVSGLQAKRSGLESAVTTNAASLAELETRLSAVRGQHETESKLVRDLETRRNAQSEELRKLRENVIRKESALSALKAEKDELEQAVMHDREDVRDMKKKMGEIQVETKALKEVLEKLRRDARQQKGLVVISKKQLGTAETDKDKVQSDIATAEQGEGLEEAASPATVRRDLASPRSLASPALQADSVLSPAASVRSTNPFDRFGAAGTAPTSSSSRPESPAVFSSQLPGHPGAGTAALAGVGAGAVLGDAAAAATAAGGAFDQAKEGEDDPFALPRSVGGSEQETVAPTTSAGGFDDAFSVPAAAAAQQQPNNDFDDNFGDDFGASAAAAPAATTAVPATTTAFDDAFGNDFAPTEPGSGDAAAPAKDPAQASVPDADFGSAFAPVQAVKTPDGAATEPEHVAQSDEEDQGPVHHQDNDSDSDDSSDDDDEGPEDVGGYKSPVPAVAGGAVGGAGVGATPMTDSNASDRFPDINASTTDDDDDDDESPFGVSADAARSDDAKPSISGGLGAFGEAAEEPMAAPEAEARDAAHAPTSAAPVDASAIGAGETASIASIAPISRRQSGLGDDDDAIEVADKGRDESEAGAGLGAAGAGFAAAATAGGLLATNSSSSAGAAGAPPLSPSAEDDDVPLGQILSNRTAAAAAAAPADASASQRSLSPSSSLKTRRAPPPAPVRQSSTLSTAPTVLEAAPAGAAVVAPVGANSADSNPFGTDDFTPPSFSPTNTKDTVRSSDVPVPAAAPASGGSSAANNATTTSGGSNFDDFDSAFEDLGQADVVPASSSGAAASAGGAAASSAPMAGFDDAFDSDFAFVPSFGTAPTSSGPTSTVGAAPAIASNSNVAAPATARASNAGFEDFDSAFDPISGNASATRGSPEAHGGGGRSQTNSGSGFSFEDAFETSPSSSSGPGASGATTYAPPPGPPPPSLPERRPTQLSQAVNALADDAPPVKQLCGMGFERPKVIKALEKSNYRTEKALERLLAQA